MIGFHGQRGYGKTLNMTHFIWKQFKRDPNIIVISNTPLFFPPHPKTGKVLDSYLYRTVQELKDLFLFAIAEGNRMLQRFVYVVIDEASVAMPSRFFAKIDPFMLSFMAQSRKCNVEMVYTTQHPSRVDLVLRELTEVWYHCEPLFFHRFFRRTEQDLDPKSYAVLAELGKSYLFFPKKVYDKYDTYFKVAMDPSLLPIGELEGSLMAQFLDQNYPCDRLQALLASERRGLLESEEGVPVGGAGAPSSDLNPVQFPIEDRELPVWDEIPNFIVQGIRPKS